MSEKPEALRLADRMAEGTGLDTQWDAAKELRRLHAENERLREALAWISKRCPSKLASQELHRMHLEVAHDAGACARAALRREDEK